MALDNPGTYEMLMEEMGDCMDEALRRGDGDFGSPGEGRHIGLDAKQLTVDYLRKIWSYTEEHLRGNVGPDWKRFYSPKVMIGVPAMWNPETIGRFQDIIEEAGLPNDFRVVSEPEAAALAFFQERVNRGIMFQVS